jgi:mannose-1-phosphate guanylyltransferase
MAIKALLLCAGLGTRLRPYTNQLPKPAIPFFGLPLSYYSLYLLRRINCLDVTVNLHHLPEKMQTLLSKNELADFRFSFSHEKDQILGSGGALYHAKNLLQSADSFFAINSDEVMIPPNAEILNDLKGHHQKTKSLATLLVTDHPDLLKTLKPVWINQQGVVRGFGEKPETTEPLRPVHYTGYKIFSKDVLPLLPAGESHIFHDTLVPAMAAGALVNTHFIHCRWWETGSFANLLTATSDVIQLIHKEKQNHLRDVYESFHKEFSFTTTIQGQTNVALHSSATVKSSQCRGTVFVAEHTTSSVDVVLQNCIVDKDLKLTNSHQDTLLLNTEKP